MQNKTDLRDTDLLPIRTTEGIPPAVCEAAPTGCPVVICFASFIGSSNVLEHFFIFSAGGVWRIFQGLLIQLTSD
jgi:hypothetical protein